MHFASTRIAYGFFFLNIRNIPADFFSLPLLPMLDLLPFDCVSFSLELSLFALFIDDRESNVNDIGRDVDEATAGDCCCCDKLLEVSNRALPQP